MKYWIMPLIGVALAVLNIWNVHVNATDGLEGLNIILPALAFLGFGPLTWLFFHLGKKKQNETLKWFGSFFGFFGAFCGVCAVASVFAIAAVIIFLPSVA